MCESTYERWYANDGWKVMYIPYRVQFRTEDGEIFGEISFEYDMDTSKDVCRDTISEQAVNENEFISILNAVVPST